MTEGEVLAYLTAIVVCYWAGYKFGLARSIIHKLGSSA